MDNAGRSFNFFFLPQAARGAPNPPTGQQNEQSGDNTHRISISFQALPLAQMPNQNGALSPAAMGRLGALAAGQLASVLGGAGNTASSSRPPASQSVAIGSSSDPSSLLGRFQTQIAGEIGRAFANRPRPPPSPPPSFLRDLLAGVDHAEAPPFLQGLLAGVEHAEAVSPQPLPTTGSFTAGNLQDLIASATNTAANLGASSTSTAASSGSRPSRRSFTTTTSGGRTTVHTVVQVSVDGMQMGMDQAAMQDMIGGSAENAAGFSTIIQEMMQQLMQMMPGARQAPVNSAQLDRLLETQACVFEDRAIGSEVDPCPICLDDLAGGQEGVIMPCCRKSFHRSCAVRWLSKESNSCPVCRRSLPEHPKPEDTSSASHPEASETAAHSHHEGGRDDLCPQTASASETEALHTKSVVELRRRCRERGLDYSSCLEKKDLVALLTQQDRPNDLETSGIALCQRSVLVGRSSDAGSPSSSRVVRTSGSFSRQASGNTTADLRDTEHRNQAIPPSSSETEMAIQPVSSQSKALSLASRAKGKSSGKAKASKPPSKAPLPKRSCKRSAAKAKPSVPKLQLRKRPGAAENVAPAHGAEKRRRSC